MDDVWTEKSAHVLTSESGTCSMFHGRLVTPREYLAGQKR